MYNSWK